ncbi:1,4-beta-xylanase [alpha proteobacterium AAP81b]|nr:1,4-beta-xylanase [alpha proteobacterium AAP81b]
MATENSAQPWPAADAQLWHYRQPWLVGCNFTPSSAVNQLEMWQAASFDAATIDRELALAASLGMNALRVYLHDLVFAADPLGFLARIDSFLDIAAAHGLRTMLVLFDSCWHPEPALGDQPAPTPGVHNSGWVQSPGTAALADPANRERLRAYVETVVGRFADDPRVLAWDIWNEPDNGPEVSRCDPDELAAKAALVIPLLVDAFRWARGRRPSQPLTSALWLGDWSKLTLLSGIQAIQLAHSDIISFHNYGDADDFGRRVQWLKAFDRPILCTEFMARPTGSTFEAILPLARAKGVGALCWGLVRGKTQTHLPWDSWATPYLEGPAGPWFHDIFEADGTPHDAAEVAFLRAITAANDGAARWVAAE